MYASTDHRSIFKMKIPLLISIFLLTFFFVTNTVANYCNDDPNCRDWCMQLSDKDGDGYIGESFLCDQEDCDDDNSSIYPGAPEICGDGIDQDCNGQDKQCPQNHDADGDGYDSTQYGGTDCDDGDPNINPSMPEICGNQVDENCDGIVEDCNYDRDQDQYVDYMYGGTDCNDQDASIHPGAPEICGDGIDQDCDGQDLSCNTSDNGSNITNNENTANLKGHVYPDGYGYDQNNEGGCSCNLGEKSSNIDLLLLISGLLFSLFFRSRQRDEGKRDI